MTKSPRKNVPDAGIDLGILKSHAVSLATGLPRPSGKKTYTAMKSKYHAYTPMKFKDIVNLYFTKFAVICLPPSISPSNQHINGCFILTENWYALPMVFFSIIRDSEQNDQISHLKVFGSKSMPKHMLVFILVKKYLKYTLHALNIPMTSEHDTMTVFTPLCM